MVKTTKNVKVMCYTSATGFLGNSQEKKIAYNTVVRRISPDCVAIVLHRTPIVRFYANGSIVLNSGGWRTTTTKSRINQFSPVRVFSHNGEWRVYDASQGYSFQSIPFTDGMVFRSKNS